MQNRWLTLRRILLVVLIFTMTAVMAQDSTELADQVSLLQLDRELHSRSQVGGLTVDKLGYIYVANFYDAVWKISPEGQVNLLTDGLYGSSGNAIDQQGNLFQANFLSNTIVKIDRFGNASSYLESGLNGPVGMVFDQDNRLYVCNFRENQILRITPDKQISIFAKGDLFNGPNGMTIDGQDHVYVVNFNSNQVIRISPQGKAEVFASIPGIDGNAHIVFYNDRLFVTKIKSNQVFQLNGNGEVRLLAGNGQTAIIGGPGKKASFSAPNGIGVDAQSGIIYVNNVEGKWTSRQPSKIKISRIQLLTVQEILRHYLDKNDISAAQKAFWEYHRDAFHADEDLGPAIGALGWQYMAARNVQAALTLFTLASEAYPERWRPYYNLAEVYKIIGQPEKAREYYQKSLEKDPGNPLVTNKLKSL